MLRTVRLALPYVALCALFFAMASAVPARVAGGFLSAEEIAALLTDRVVEGNQDGRAWRQSFSAGGATVYSEAGRDDSLGRWAARSDAEGGLYCSLWPPSGNWGCYRLTWDGKTVAWVPLGGGDVWPARFVDR